MKIKLVKEEISIVMESLKEQYDMMSTHETTIPQIELDIFMRNIQKLYENTIYLNNHNSSGERNEVKTSTEFVIEKTSSESILTTDQVEEVEDKAEEIKEAKPEEPKISSEVTEVYEQREVKETKIDIQEDETPNHPVASEEIVDDFDDLIESKTEDLDLFTNVKAAEEIKDLNNKLAEARNSHSIVEKLQNKRIENLKSVIGINDKFYFINELFNGNAQKYEDIIYTLNNFKKLEDAMQYFSTLKYRFGWDEESEAYDKLTKMLERKFNLISA